MDIGQIVKLVIAILTIITGAVSIILPQAAARFTGFGSNVSARGISEIRAVLGGLFVGLGLAPILLGGSATAYQVLGFAYLGGAITRTVSILILDKDTSRSSLISVGFEWVAGLLLVLLP